MYMQKTTSVLGMLALLICGEVNATTNSCKEAAIDVKANRFAASDERKPAYKRRKGGARLRTLCEPNNCIMHENNGDEKQINDFAAQFTKGLEHDPVTGLLTPNGQQNYKKLLKALNTGSQKTYNDIQRAPQAIRKFT